MVPLVRAAWQRVQQPRVIAVAYLLAYLGLAGGGLSAVTSPPTSIEGHVGTTAMYTLALLLTFGGVVGAVAVLPGRYWLERVAVLAIGVATSIYAVIVVTLHVTSSGNRLLQLSLIVFAGAMQLVRWHRIRERPYDPDRPPPTKTT